MALMAPSQPPFLEVTQPDDDMEISSDAGRLEHDNDIDLVDGDDDFDYMLEDTRSEQGNPRIDNMPDASRDDIMYDDLDEITYVEDTMHDDIPVPDEHLSDVSEIHEEVGFGHFTQPRIVEDESNAPQTNILESFDSSHAQQVPDAETLIDTIDYYEPEQEGQDTSAVPQTTIGEILANEPVLHVTELEVQVQEQSHEHDDVVAHQNDEHHEGNVALNLSHEEEFNDSSNHGVDAHMPSAAEPQVVEGSPKNASNDHQPSDDFVEHQNTSPLQSEIRESIVPQDPDNNSSPKSPAQSDHNEAQVSPQQTENDKDTQLEGKRSSEDETRSLHAVTVDYDGAHISLFPPMQGDEADMFLLKDSSLADKTLVDLFRACRQVLGDSISEDIELEIYSEDLDLTISEDSVHCMTTSFSQLIDVYVTLCQQDGIEQPESFFISLTKKSRFSSRLTALYLAASESKGLSAVQIEPYSEEFPEIPEEYQDEHDQPEDETVPEQSIIEAEVSKFQDLEKKEIGEEQNIAPITIDTKHIDGETGAAYEESTDVNGSNIEGDDTIAKIGESEEYAQEQFDEQQIPGDEHEELHGSELQAESNAETGAFVEDDLLNHTGGAENGDDESSGSSTVQGENDPLQPYTAYEGSPERLPPISELAGENLAKSNPAAHAQPLEVAAPENAEWQETEDHIERTDPNTEGLQIQDDEEYLLNPGAVAHDWDQLSRENLEHGRDEHHEELPQPEDAREHVTENEWGTFDDELDFDFGNEQPEDEAAPAPHDDIPTSSGTFRVPDDSADEDEDSITYDDEQLDLLPQPEPDTAQARPTSHSPLGKRNREDGEDGGDDSSDQESKRLRSQ